MESKGNAAKSPRELLRTYASCRVAVLQSEYLSKDLLFKVKG